MRFPRLTPEEIIKSRQRITKEITIIDKQDILHIIYDFVYITSSYKATAEKWGYNEKDIKALIKLFKADLNNLTDSWALMDMLPHLDHAVGSTSKQTYDPLKSVVRFNAKSDHNKEFLTLISPEEEPTLTEQEQTYAILYSNTGNNEYALTESGLAVGLTLKKGLLEGNAVNNFRLRGYFLRSKSNVNRYILELRERKITDLNLNKNYIQMHLVQIIEQLQEDGEHKDKLKILKALELLGKTIPGTFSETINITEVRPDEALDKLLEMTKVELAKSTDKPSVSNLVEFTYSPEYTE